jgi:hypothetical protein
MIYAPECVYSTELKDYNRTLDINTSPEPIQEGKCAKYACSDSIKVGVCASSNYKDHFNINVTLSDVCDEGAKCKIGGEPNDVFYNGSNIEGKCGSLNNMRYPGEKCNINSDAEINCIFSKCLSLSYFPNISKSIIFNYKDENDIQEWINSINY